VEREMSEVDRLKHGAAKLLLIWSIISIVIGAALSLGSSNTILNGIGLQAVIWGIIDAIIGLSILFKQKEQSVEKIAKTVATSIRFDIIFQVAGLIVVLIFLQNPYYMGNGVGIIVQGFFLFLLDNNYMKSLKNLPPKKTGTQDS
jgi:hypothetical protein